MPHNDEYGYGQAVNLDQWEGDYASAPAGIDPERPAAPAGPQEITYSALAQFRNCRRAFELRNIQQLVPVQKEESHAFGTLIHGALELWHRDRELESVLAWIDAQFPNRIADADQKRNWHFARAMMCGYAMCYPQEDFDIVALEQQFSGPIVNPDTGAASRSFALAGKVDAIVRTRETGEYFVLEHKTASVIDGNYLDKLWMDFQITIYAHYVEQTMGIPIAGILYNILVKTKIKQAEGETEEEFEIRRADLLAKSKTGKTTAKRQLPEPYPEFAGRLAEKYREPHMFHRETLYLSRDRFNILRAELWELTKSLLEARRRGMYYQNTSQCFAWNRPCAYLPLCKGGANPVLIENLYQKAEPNQELCANSLF